MIKLYGMLDRILTRKKNRTIFIGIVVGILLLIAGVFGFVAYKGYKELTGNDSSSPSYYIESMDYRLRKNATDLQKDLFKELKEACEAEALDYEQIAVCVAKNFAADFYTWSNKTANYDVGGMYYVDSELKPRIQAQAKDTFYANLNEYIEKYGSENLPEVETMSLHRSASSSVEIGGEMVDVYYVHVEWTYKEGAKFADEFTTHGVYDVALVNGRMEILNAYY